MDVPVMPPCERCDCQSSVGYAHHTFSGLWDALAELLGDVRAEVSLLRAPSVFTFELHLHDDRLPRCAELCVGARASTAHELKQAKDSERTKWSVESREAWAGSASRSQSFALFPVLMSVAPVPAPVKGAGLVTKLVLCGWGTSTTVKVIAVGGAVILVLGCLVPVVQIVQARSGQRPTLEDAASEQMQDSRQRALHMMREDLDQFLLQNPLGTYEQWIQHLHPENVRKNGVLDPRFYLNGSDHLQVWNRRLYPLRRVRPRDIVPETTSEREGS
eukprot:TRINITY_DN32258_c0_g1_i1.p1 TRINITY_DN32258_c0_g1~~TRINITY_DN32258_c0_g1_i1.p1  ORF type:complete len:274 (+),score=41.65 TRINITY_DN32258_c0_g1_i1:60-881(+)